MISSVNAVWVRHLEPYGQRALTADFHASLSEVQRYTKAVDRKRMAREAMAKLVEKGW